MGLTEVKALIFDFDGLVVDTESAAYASWQEVYAAYGCDLPLALWERRIGSSGAAFDPCAYLESQARVLIDHTEIRARRWRRKLELVAKEPLLPGVHDYIVAAKRLHLKTAVASSSLRSWVQEHLERLGIMNCFDCIVCAEDVMHVKPDPALYLDTLIKLQVEATQAIAFEDSPNGILAAKRAGITCVAVPNLLTRQMLLDQADMSLNSLSDVPLEVLLRDIDALRRGLMNPTIP